MLINKKAVKNYALEFAKENRGDKFTRVGNSFIIYLELKLKEAIQRAVFEHPSIGKTLK